MDLIYAPSQSTKNELVEKGIRADKIQVYPRGIDTHRFNPSKRNGFFKCWNCDDNSAKLIYVGRVSKEKNLHLLAEAYRLLVQSIPDVLLTIVGDGPYLDEMKAEMDDLPCIFTGRLEGEDLAAVYASSDLFVFPSTTDTFGNVVLEAQASGIPVIVTELGGPAENIIPEKTGLVVKADCTQSILNAMAALVADPHRRLNMGRAARDYMENRSFETAFDETWKMFSALNANKMAIAG
jgi:glycosyltransferase involved in cell wall biosynthesis